MERIALDESWAYFIKWLLLGPIGMNIRNDLAHGFVHDAGPVYSALVLRAAAVLVPLTRPDVGTAESDGDDLRSLRLEDEPPQDAGARRARSAMKLR